MLFMKVLHFSGMFTSDLHGSDLNNKIIKS